MHEFPSFLDLVGSRSITLGVDSNDTLQPDCFDLVLGPRVQSVMAFQAEQAKLRGMNESNTVLSLRTTKCDVRTETDTL